MITYLIIFIHLLIVIFYCLYSIIINTKYDYIFLSYTYLILLSWGILKGECILSYIYKKIHNKDYVLGSFTDKDDIDYLLGNYSYYRLYIFIIINILFIINLYIVIKRNNIKIYYFYIFIFLCFIRLINLFNNKNINTNFQLFNNIILILIILFGIYFYINNKKIFNKDNEEQNI